MILNGKVINPGELNTSIVLEERRIEKDASGFPRPVVGRQISVWCRWINAHGRELWQADAAGVNAPATVLIRFQAELDETWRVIYRGKTWEIRSIDNLRERDEWMELKVVRVGAA